MATGTEKFTNTGFETDLSSWTTGFSATGGTITTSGNYTIHTFTTVGSDTFTPNSSGTVNYLVVGGGGGGGNNNGGAFWGSGGGGAGGMLTGSTSVSAQGYTISVGAGGVANTNGDNSAFGVIATALGGGRGGNANGLSNQTGGDGGSGGGGGGYNTAGGNGTSGQGTNGGSMGGDFGGGGGGAGVAGSGRQGGDGLQSNISGVNTYYAGGGSGGYGAKAGGLGGGGAVNSAGTDGLGGGGGSGDNGGAGKKGGSGIVIIRYLTQTAIRDTGTKYTGSASVKIVNGANVQNFTQSVNVGDTNNYNLVAYAYIDGTTAVDSTYTQLYYNGSALTTTYTDVGSGWYKLSATITGANESRTYGVQVAANKTVYVDDFSLKNYSSSGTLTSNIYDTSVNNDWGTLTYAATTPSNTSVSVKVRTGNQSDLSDATAFSSCSAISSGSTVGGTTCTTNTQRYAQYQISLANTDSVSTPTFTSFSLAFSASLPTAPSSLSGSAGSTSSITWSWTDNASNESGFYVQDTSGNTKCTVSSASSGTGGTVTCTEGSLSPNTSYTRKVVAYNGSGNSTASSNASATTRAVPSPSLDSPSDNTYTTGDRPSFRFRTPTDNTTTKLYSDVSSYRLYVKDSDGKEIFSISAIPSSRTTDYTDDPKYVAKYEGFGDSDITNNYITVYTKSTANWGSSENDGKLKEGKNTWAVASRDGSNNESATERTIYYDTTAPTITLSKLGSLDFDTKYDNWYYTQLKPALSGKASEQGTVNIVFDKKGFNTGILGGYGNFITANVNTDSSGNFSWTPELEYGQYQVTIKAKDQAGNTSSEIKFNLDVETYDNLVSQGIIRKTPTVTPTPTASTTKEGKIITTPQPTITTQPKEGGPIIPSEPNVIQKVGTGIVKTTSVIASGAWQSLVNNFQFSISNFQSIFNDSISIASNVVTTTGKGLTFAGQKTGQALSFIGTQIGNGINSVASTTGSGLAYTSSTIARGYNNLADNAPGVAKTVLIGFRNGVTTAAKATGNIAQGISNTTGQAINSTKEGIANIAFGVGERTERFSDSLGFTIVKLGYLFVNEPTTISDVKVAKLDLTTAKITWNTNHPATSKVNYGLTQDFGNDIQSQKRVTQHEIVITGLKPNTQYFYEVMSQNKNYVFDANHTFTTLDDRSKKEKTNEKPVKNNKTKTIQPKTNKK